MHQDGQRIQDDRIRLCQGRDVINCGQININGHSKWDLTMIEIGLLLYWIAGLLLGTIGPAGRSIQREVENARGTEFTNAIMQRKPPSEKKLFFFKLTLILGFSLLWPFLLWGALKENEKHEMKPNSNDSRSEGIKFQYLGGHGTLSCNQCNFSESLTSFIHGIDSSRTGYQCQACGKFASRIRIQRHRRSKVEIQEAQEIRNESGSAYEASLICECGGKLNREQILFCPDCKSKDMSYSMEYIT